jgi:hypothetical protein
VQDLPPTVGEVRALRPPSLLNFLQAPEYIFGVIGIDRRLCRAMRIHRVGSYFRRTQQSRDRLDDKVRIVILSSS